MKKTFCLVAVASLFVMACNKENTTPAPAVESIGLVASIENLETKATMGGSYNLLWTAGDYIGVYISDWGDRNKPFVLQGAGGSSSGKFNYAEGDFTATSATYAFFPWQGDNGYTCNNIWDGTYFLKMPASYNSYVSGQMLTPLVASVSYDSDKGTYNPIEFKHVGAAVKVTIKNLNAHAHSISMTVDGQNVYGDFSVNPDNVISGTESYAAADGSNSTIWLNYTHDTVDDFTFIFPIPTVDTPKLSFQIYDTNNALVWSKNLKAQESDLGRADLLEMPELDFTGYTYDFYANFPGVSDDWFLKGDFNGWSDGDMWYETGNGAKWCVAKGVSISTSQGFKIYNKDGTWYPSGSNKYLSDFGYSSDGVYDVMISWTDDHTIQVVPTGTFPPLH